MRYSDEPIDAKLVKDFLPSPENLILKEAESQILYSQNTVILMNKLVTLSRVNLN
jgi:hypothetical protein